MRGCIIRAFVASSQLCYTIVSVFKQDSTFFLTRSIIISAYISKAVLEASYRSSPILTAIIIHNTSIATGFRKMDRFCFCALMVKKIGKADFHLNKQKKVAFRCPRNNHFVYFQRLATMSVIDRDSTVCPSHLDSTAGVAVLGHVQIK